LYGTLACLFQSAIPGTKYSEQRKSYPEQKDGRFHTLEPQLTGIEQLAALEKQLLSYETEATTDDRL
jgi:hypothetical protein